MLFLLGATWGSSFLLLKIALRDVSPATVIAFRIGRAAGSKSVTVGCDTAAARSMEPPDGLGKLADAAVDEVAKLSGIGRRVPRIGASRSRREAALERRKTSAKRAARRAQRRGRLRAPRPVSALQLLKARLERPDAVVELLDRLDERADQPVVGDTLDPRLGVGLDEVGEDALDVLRDDSIPGCSRASSGASSLHSQVTPRSCRSFSVVSRGSSVMGRRAFPHPALIRPRHSRLKRVVAGDTARNIGRGWAPVSGAPSR